MDHKQVEIVHRRIGKVTVDEGMATLLQALWKAGINTEFSCQGEPPRTTPDLHLRAYIMFTSASSMERFIDMVAASGDPLLCQRVYETTQDFPWPVAWSIEASPQYVRVQAAVDYARMVYVVRFPHRDIPVLEQAFREFYPGLGRTPGLFT